MPNRPENDALFQPLDIRGHTLRNRIVMPPMVVCRGIATPEAAEWYGRRAQGGVALVIVEATSLPSFGSELTAENLRPLVDAIHSGGALAAIQIFPCDRTRPSALAELSTSEIEAMVAHYQRAASICRAAGFEGVEPHGAHGYLLNQFFSPVQNCRQDGYGGTPEGRMRLACEIVEATRAGLGDESLLLYRHTPIGAGYGLPESLELARRLVARGVDVLDLSPSSIESPGDLAAPFRALGVPVIAVNRLNIVERALEALALGRTDLVAVGRGLIADPDWPRKVREGRQAEIVECIECDGCHVDLVAGRPVNCTQW